MIKVHVQITCDHYSHSEPVTTNFLTDLTAEVVDEGTDYDGNRRDPSVKLNFEGLPPGWEHRRSGGYGYGWTTEHACPACIEAEKQANLLPKGKPSGRKRKT